MQYIGWQLAKISNKIRREIDRRMAHTGLTLGQTQIIRFICKNEGNLVIQKNIEERFEIRGSSATNTLQVLEKNGFIERRALENDKRVKSLHVTAKALRLIDEVSLIISSVEEEVSSALTDEEKCFLQGICEKINFKIEKF